MDSARLPTIIPIWISGFEQVMPDTRKYLRFLPRPGKKISITIGDPITSKIEPLVNEWKRLAALEKRGGKSLGVGGEWSGATEKVLSGIRDAETRVSVAAALSPERRERGMGKIAEGREVLVRKHICGVLSHELAALGRGVEEREGKDKDEWRNAVRRQG
jgi:monolysocardiolipin acyltransferase